jgi:hypothetical protein
MGAGIALLLQSPLSPWSTQFPGSESSLFLYGAAQQLDNNMLYRDVFDFHAPLVFLINMLGLLIGGRVGLWVLEIHFVVLTLLILFVMLRRHTHTLAAFFTCLILAALIAHSLQGGNLIEEYAMLFQALALMTFMDCMAQRRVIISSTALMGISAALTFCLKPALTLFWLPFLILICALLIKRRGWGSALAAMTIVIFSAALILVLLLFWLYVNNALASWYDMTILFYRDLILGVTPAERLEVLRSFANHPSLALTVVFSLLLIVQRLLAKRTTGAQREKSGPLAPVTLPLIVANLVAAILLLAVAVLEGRADERLVLQGLICLVIPLACLIDLVVPIVRERSRVRAVLALALVALLGVSLMAPGVGATIERVKEQWTRDQTLSEQKELVGVIRGSLIFDEPIIVFGDDCWIYSAAGTYSATRYPYQPFSETFRSDLNADFYRQAEVSEATLLVGRSDAGLVERYPGIRDYQLIFKNERFEVYYRSPEAPEEAGLL